MEHKGPIEEIKTLIAEGTSGKGNLLMGADVTGLRKAMSIVEEPFNALLEACEAAVSWIATNTDEPTDSEIFNILCDALRKVKGE